MKKKIGILLGILILFTPISIQARAGGGGGESSGGGSSSSHGSNTTHHDLSSDNDSLGSTFSLIGMGCLVLLIPSISIIGYRLKLKKNIKLCKKRLTQMDDLDPIWNKQQLYQRIEDIYFHVQTAWTSADIEAMKPYMSEHLYDQWSSKLNWMNVRHEQNILKKIRLLHKDIIGIDDSSENEEASCWFYIHGKMVDYTIDTDTGRIINGQKISLPFIEFWKLIQHENQFYLDEVRQKDEINQADIKTNTIERL